MSNFKCSSCKISANQVVLLKKNLAVCLNGDLLLLQHVTLTRILIKSGDVRPAVH